MAPLNELLAAAVRLHRSGQLAAAEQACQTILAAEPNYLDALKLLGIISSQLGKHDVAISVLNRAIALRPGDASIHSNLGSALRVQGKLEEAAGSFHRAIELKPDDALAFYNLGTVLRMQGKGPEAVA